MKFNVLTDPWIPVRDEKGEITKLGVMPLLKNAHHYVEVSDALPIYEYGIYRFLFAFLMDTYKPEIDDDIRDLYDEGQFDSERLENYVADCEKEGASFDLFDPERPFMQVPLSSWDDDKAKKPIAYLNPTLPTGNNHIHFDHRLQQNVTMTCDEAAKALCSVNLFCTVMAMGSKRHYPSGINGVPPIYAVIKGKNLFETLVYGMMPISDYENYADPGPFWRWQGQVESEKKIPKTSLLFGLTFPARKITLIPSETQELSEIYYSAGMNFFGYDSWRDPNVTYMESKKGRVSLKPSVDKEPWRNLGSIYDAQNSAPDVVKQFIALYGDSENYIHLNTYSVVTENAKYVDLQKGEYVLAKTIVENGNRMDTLKEMLAYVEDRQKQLAKAINQLAKSVKKDSDQGSVKAEKKNVTTLYYAKCQNIFLNQVCVELAGKIEGLDALVNKWQGEIRKTMLSNYDRFVDLMDLKGDGLMEAEKIKIKILFGKGGRK
jgi:CRISPR system Cascade subunit CasA